MNRKAKDLKKCLMNGNIKINLNDKKVLIQNPIMKINTMIVFLVHIRLTISFCKLEK